MRTGTKALALALNLLVVVPAAAVEEGEMAPEFKLPILGGDASVSLSDSRGKVRYIDFWASWCPPCRVSIPRIIALQEELGGESFEVIAINLDERVEDALRFYERYEMNYVNLSDPEGEVAETYDLLGMPMSYVVDPEGRITLAHAGFKRGDMARIRSNIFSGNWAVPRLRIHEALRAS